MALGDSGIGGENVGASVPVLDVEGRTANSLEAGQAERPGRGDVAGGGPNHLLDLVGVELGAKSPGIDRVETLGRHQRRHAGLGWDAG